MAGQLQPAATCMRVPRGGTVAAILLPIRYAILIPRVQLWLQGVLPQDPDALSAMPLRACEGLAMPRPRRGR